jgi:signal transduction histidine kinase
MSVDLTIDPDLFSDDDSDAIPEQQTTALFRMTQEALSNVARHSKADHVRVVLRRENMDGAKGISLIIEDNGAGFDLPGRFEDLAEIGHYGLLGQRERAEILGGELFIWSAPGQGTRLTAWVPLHVSDSLLELQLLHTTS